MARSFISRLCFLRPPLLSLLLAILLLPACETVEHYNPSGIQHYTQLQKLRYWKAEGKISVKIGQERQNAAFTWEQIRKNYNIHLFGPFGWGSTWIKRNRYGVTLENASHGRLKAETPETLLQQSAGWQVPISDLQFWIRGVPSPEQDVQAISSEDNGTITALEQAGWKISYKKPTRHKGWVLPGKLLAQRGNIQVTLVIKRWSL